MNALELKIPPPVVALLAALAMWVAARKSGDAWAPEVVRLALAIALAGVGAAFDLSGLLAFRRAKTTINPVKPQSTSAMVTSGVYQLTRNPMYLGLAFALCAWAVYLWSGWALLGPVAFVTYVTQFQIVPEERTLTELFGADYTAYKARVRRWL
jgi:protein-S-isoprenylcysteine O-methyltransferase Ste14